MKEGLTIPEEIQRREALKAALKEAKAAMEQRYQEAEEEAKREAAEKGKQGKGGKQTKPQEQYQHNFTDSESRIMKVGNGEHGETRFRASSVTTRRRR